MTSNDCDLTWLATFPYPARVRRYLDILLDIKALRAALTWPVFSITSYQMVSALDRQGIRPHTVIDVGANVGQFAIAASRIFPDARIYCFEPIPAAAEAIKKHALPNIQVTNVAIGDSDGRATLHVNSHSQSSSLLALGARHQQAFPEAKEVASVEVAMTTLDAIAFDLAPPVLLKLDVQGYEAKVLAGATRLLTRCDFVVIEMSMEPMYDGETTFPEMLTLLRSCGFRFVRPVGWLQHPHTGAVLQLDGLFERL